MTLRSNTVAKVPAITLGFWITKILANTFGDTGGDAISMSWLGETTAGAGSHGINGYLAGSLMFGVVLIILVRLQIRAWEFNPSLYWATIVASTTTGTTLADLATRSLGIGYPSGSVLFFALVIASLLTWHRTLGTIDVRRIASARAETFYWITITFSQTLGTALGDWVADGAFGYSGAALVFGAALLVLVLLYYWTFISTVGLFWSAFILTRPLGASLGDILDKPIIRGGLAMSRSVATAALAVMIIILLILLPQRPTRRPRQDPR